MGASTEIHLSWSETESAEGYEEISNLVEHFTYQLDSLRETFAVAMPAVIAADRQRQSDTDAEIQRFWAAFVSIPETDPVRRSDHFSKNISLMQRASREIKKANRAPEIAANSLFISLFTIFDAFIGSWLRLVVTFKPHIISEKTLTLREILAYGSLEKAQQDILDKEVEDLLRESYTKQFEYFKKNLDIKTLDKGLDVWPEFIEMSQRRNLLVHTDGKVSQQYLDECRKASVRWPSGQSPEVGTKLTVDEDYFHRAHFVCYEVGFKLSQVLYRVAAPGRLAAADQLLVTHLYDLLDREEWALAAMVGSFATGLPSYSTDMARRMLLVNAAQAHKWGGNAAAAAGFLDKDDWSSCSDEFRIALAVLRDDFVSAERIMRRIGPNGVVKKMNYAQWPLFREFRKQPLFTEAYQAIFGEPFSVSVEQSVREEALQAEATGESNAAASLLLPPADRPSPSSNTSGDGRAEAA